MPHKHTRTAKDADPALFNLPPSSIARPLPVSTGPLAQGSKKRKRENAQAPQDDTPKAFSRALKLMKFGRKPTTPDDGNVSKTKKERWSQSSRGVEISKAEVRDVKGASSHTPAASSRSQDLTIQPSERLSEFSARVNQAMPIAGTSRKSKKMYREKFGDLLKERQTKTEKRMQKMQDEWRAEDARIKEREEEAREQAEEEQERHWGSTSALENGEKRSKRKRRLGGASSGRLGSDDPWASLSTAREQRRGLHDYAQAPPKLEEVREKLKVNGAMVDVADVPGSAGSLRRREELGQARRDIIDGYRKMMEDKRSKD